MLDLVLCCDDFCVTNGLGPAAKDHTITAVYLKVYCKNRYMLDNIY